MVFYDHKPAAQHHLLVTPRKHIVSVKDLRERDVGMVEEMGRIGDACLNELNVPPDMRLMGFHIPPFNSVDHIHLHVFGLPWKSETNHAKYPVIEGEGGLDKGWSWFVEINQAIQILRKGARVTIAGC